MAANGVPYINIHDDETEELMILVQDITEKNVSKNAIHLKERRIGYVPAFECPTCKGLLSGTISNYCYHCGQKLEYTDYLKAQGELCRGGEEDGN